MNIEDETKALADRPFCPNCDAPIALATGVIPQGADRIESWHCTPCGHTWPAARSKAPECPQCRSSRHVTNAGVLQATGEAYFRCNAEVHFRNGRLNQTLAFDLRPESWESQSG